MARQPESSGYIVFRLGIETFALPAERLVNVEGAPRSTCTKGSSASFITGYFDPGKVVIQDLRIRAQIPCSAVEDGEDGPESLLLFKFPDGTSEAFVVDEVIDFCGREMRPLGQALQGHRLQEFVMDRLSLKECMHPEIECWLLDLNKLRIPTTHDEVV